MKFRNHYVVVLFLCCISFVHIGFASEYRYCKPSVSVLNDYEPERFITSNNLLAKAGAHAIFCGEKIIIYGRLTDDQCAPISDAKVYLWQVNCQGKYPYKPLRNSVDTELIDITSAKKQSFTGNGIATTNNHGEFVFITTYPNKVHAFQPHLNIRVEHYKHGTFQTNLVLSGSKIYNLEKVIPDQDIVDFAMRYGTNIYGFNVVMPTIDYSKYE